MVIELVIWWYQQTPTPGQLTDINTPECVAIDSSGGTSLLVLLMTAQVR